MHPKFTITGQQQVKYGGLSSSDMQKIHNLLAVGGAIVVPSDTCYGIAVEANNVLVKDTIKKILPERRMMPLTLSVADVIEAQKVIQFDNLTANLFELFTPGPITVVNLGKDESMRAYARDVLDSHDGTIGLRIPASAIEREVSNLVKHPITTTAVRDENDNTFRDFEKVRNYVNDKMTKAGISDWAIIQHVQPFSSKESTVVKVNSEKKSYDILRNGSIEPHLIEQVYNRLSNWTYRP